MGDGEPPRARVLVVDDDPDTRAITAGALCDRYDVTTAASFAEALGRARGQVPNVIIIDLMLGKESGWELIRSLQVDPRLRAVPIVVVSGRGELEPPPGVRRCAAYVRKPCRMSQLRALLAELLAQPRAIGRR